MLLVLVACTPDDDDDPQSVELWDIPIEQYDPLDFVDPMIGTGGIGAAI
ncbi:MAG: hypothetical protein HN348_16335, partial [Proteobacteria bacterium]|nr:hypothetical protein [Pseudomonadota bacterium]